MESETDFESDLTDIELFDKCRKPELKLDSIKKHVCPYEGCHSAFNRPWKLERHVNTHTNNRPFKCDIEGCHKDYTHKTHLQRHKALSHANKKSILLYVQCPIPDCGKVFANKWSLKKHMNSHFKSQSYKCTHCDDVFKKHGQLKKHVLTHLGMKPFNCQLCQSSFSTKKELKKHEKKHKTYQCEELDCSEEFSTFHALRKHKKAQHPNWLICDFCGKTYLNKCTLADHILSHLPKENRDVLKCPFEDCLRYYFHQRNLDHHIKSYHKNINHQCTICQKTLVTRTKLREHLKLHSESNEPPVKKIKNPRQFRKDKGLPRKSMAAILSGIELPPTVDRNLAQNKITQEDYKYLENVKEIFSNCPAEMADAINDE